MGTWKYVCCLRSRGKPHKKQKAIWWRMLLPTVRDLCTAFLALFAFCVPHSLLLFPTLHSPGCHPCLSQRQASQLPQRQGAQGAQKLRPLSLLRFMPPVLDFSAPSDECSVLHQKPLKSLADRMATDWNKCLVIVYVHCYIHVCMCVCVLECRGFGKNFAAYKANDDLRRIPHAWAANPLPLPQVVLGVKLILMIWNNTSSMQQNLPLGFSYTKWSCDTVLMRVLQASFLQDRTWNWGAGFGINAFLPVSLACASPIWD